MANGTRENKKERTRIRIIDEAFALFEKKGYDATTVEEIASAADLTSRTFFRYFTSKEDLVLLGQDAENRQVAELLKARPAHGSDLDLLLKATRFLLDWTPATLARAKRSRRLILATPALRNRERGVLAEMEDIMCRGLTPPRARKSEALRVRLLVAAYLATLSTMMNAYLQGDVRATPEELLDEVGRLLRCGFGD